MVRRDRFRSTTFLILTALLLIPLSLSAELERVEWSELADHVSDQLLTEASLEIHECGAEAMDKAPSREVLQVIENVFYKWRELDRTDAFGNQTRCLVMVKPESKVLTLEESRVLLTASSLWRRVAHRARSIQIPASHPDLQGEPAVAPAPRAFAPFDEIDGPDTEIGVVLGEGPSEEVESHSAETEFPEIVIGSDERTRVSSSVANGYPWNTIGYISTTFPNSQQFRATGFMVAPYTALTNGHVVYNSSRGGWVTALSLSPGQTQASAGGFVTRPFGTKSATDVRSNSGYINTGDSQYDYAGVLFNSSFSFGTYMPLVFDVVLNSSNVINGAGYPKEVQFETNSQGMWNTYNNVRQTNGRVLEHYLDTSGGNSGGPLWQYFSSSMTRRVVALHSFGSSGGYNGGPRLVSQNQGLIEDWMNYTPGGGSGPCIQDLDGGTVCLRSGRFEITATWTSFSSPPETKPIIWTAVEDINALGGFQNNPSGIQVVVRIANGCSAQFGNTYWITLGGFTGAGWDITVRDVQTGIQRTFFRFPDSDNFPTTVQDSTTFDCN